VNGKPPGNAPSGKAFWACLVAGWTVMAFGLRGVLQNSTATHPANLSAWFFGSGLVHDLLLAPAVFLIAVVLGRLVPARARGIVQAGLIVSALVVLVALPLILSPGPPGNPSALPRNYPVGLSIVVGTVWAATGLLLLVGTIRRG
jgi:hypothetical protein